jgi:hypothetical protein
LAEVRARLGMARHLDALAETDEAIDQLERVAEMKPDAPYSSLALAYLRLGEAHDRLNARTDALAAYQLATQAAPARDLYNIRRQAAARARKAPNAQLAEAFRLSLDGWRQFGRKDLASAAAALERALALNPADPVAQYRYGRVLQAQREDTDALAHFELAIRHGKQCPAPILATAHLEAARLHERLGHRDQALSAYRIASTLFGAADETRRTAAQAVARLQKQ